jgi:hypothetical protein
MSGSVAGAPGNRSPYAGGVDWRRTQTKCCPTNPGSLHFGNQNSSFIDLREAYHVNKFPAVLSLLLILILPAQAAVVLTFEGVGDLASVLEYYNGGADSAGNSGTDYGISFGPSFFGLVDQDVGGSGNFANEPSASTVLLFQSAPAVLNVPAGFDTGFSFFYSAVTAITGAVNVFDGLNATGTLLASFDLPTQFNQDCVGDPTGAACNWDPIGLGFAGTAYSVDFSPAAGVVGFDNITFGRATPGVPAPGTLALLGLGLAGLVLRHRGQAQLTTTRTRRIAQRIRLDRAI